MTTAYIAPSFGAGWQALDNLGNPLSGGLLYTYSAGTTTPYSTWTDSTLGTPNANPIILNSAGRPPNEIWFDSSSYKFVLMDSAFNTLGTWDGLVGTAGPAGSTPVISGTSLTSQTIGTGSFTFVTQANIAWVVGQWVTVSYSTTPSNYFYGQITAYSGTSLTVNVTVIGGSGTYASWVISISGVRGATGSPGAGSGTVTSVAVATANGFAGSVATSTTTPNITISCNSIGILQGNGTAISAITVGSGLSFSGGTLTASSSAGGTVTSVSGSGGGTGLTLTGGPITTSGTLALGGILNISNGGTGASTASGAINALLPSQTGNSGNILTTNGTSSSWVAPGSSGTVTSVSGTGTVNGITLTGTVTAAGSLTLGGTLSGVNLSTQVTGTLPVANGGTGNASLTTGYALIGNGTSSVAGLAPSTSGNIMVSNGTTWTSGTTLAGNYLYTGSNYFQNSTYIGATSTTSLALGSGSINFYSSTIGSNANTSLYFQATGSALANQAYVLAFNNGGSPAYAYSLAGDGTALKTGGGSWGSISDSRLKINITPLVGALEKINSLNPVSYDWKIVKENEPTVGFIAQDVQKILPNAVTSHIPTEEESEFIVDETMTIGWQNDMFAYLVGAIKELTAEIAELKKT